MISKPNGKASGVGADGEKAVRWLKRAGESGCTSAIFQIGESYYHGLGVERSVWEAVVWYGVAAEKGHALAQYRLGTIFEEGPERSNIKSVRWYSRAAEQGVAAAQTRLADMYYRGRGVVRSLEKTVYWYRMGAGGETLPVRAPSPGCTARA